MFINNFLSIPGVPTTCPSGFTPYTYGCYHVSSHGHLFGWSGALSYCQGKHADSKLYSPSSQDDLDSIFKLMRLLKQGEFLNIPENLYGT